MSRSGPMMRHAVAFMVCIWPLAAFGQFGQFGQPAPSSTPSSPSTGPAADVAPAPAGGAQVPAEGARPTGTHSATTSLSWPEVEADRLRQEAEKLERLHAAESVVYEREDDAVSLWPTFVRTVVMLTAVCLLAYLLLGKLLPKILQIEPPSANRRLMKVVDRLALDQKRSIMIIQLGDEFFMVGAAEQNITLMSKLDAEHVERLLAESDGPNPALTRLSDLLGRRQAKGS